MRCVRSLPSVLWLYRCASVVMLGSILLLWSCSATIPSFKESYQSVKALSPEQSTNVVVNPDNQGNRFGIGSIAFICGCGGGLLWFSWRLAKHHVRKRRSNSRSVD